MISHIALYGYTTSLNSFISCWINSIEHNVSLFLGSTSVPLIYMALLMLVVHCFCNYGFVVSFESGKYKLSNFVFLFKDCFSYSGFVVFLYELSIDFCKKKAVEISIGIVLNLLIKLESIAILTIVSLPLYYEHEMFSHLGLFKISLNDILKFLESYTSFVKLIRILFLMLLEWNFLNFTFGLFIANLLIFLFFVF